MNAPCRNGVGKGIERRKQQRRHVVGESDLLIVEAVQQVLHAVRQAAGHPQAHHARGALQCVDPPPEYLNLFRGRLLLAHFPQLFADSVQMFFGFLRERFP